MVKDQFELPWGPKLPPKNPLDVKGLKGYLKGGRRLTTYVDESIVVTG